MIDLEKLTTTLDLLSLSSFAAAQLTVAFGEHVGDDGSTLGTSMDVRVDALNAGLDALARARQLLPAPAASTNGAQP